MKFHGVGALLAPRNVVLVGASDRPGHWSRRVWGNLARFGFQGKVMPVNPGRKEIWEAACYPDLDALPEPPDHLALFVPAETSLDIIERGAALGARSATIFAAGFGEGGDVAGRALAERLRAIVAETGLAAAGPNCIGVASGQSRFVTLADELLAELRPGPIAIATQSGGLATSLNRALNDRGLEIAHLVSAGNQTCLTFADYIDFYADDPNVKVILCYIESVLDRDRFLAAALKARERRKTVVALKIGGSEAARTAALSHTGNLAGRLDIFDAYAGEVGIVRVGSLEELVEAAAYLSRAPRPAGPRVAFVTNSGAVKSLITEAAGSHGVELARLGEQTRAGLAAVLGEVEPANPLDTRNTVSADKLMGCVTTLAEAEEVDLVVAVEELPREPVERKIANLTGLDAYCGELKAGQAPVVLLSPIAFHDTDYMVELRDSLPSLAQLRGLGTTMGMLGALTRPMVARASVQAPTAPAAIGEALRRRAGAITTPTPLDEVVSKEVVAAFGIALPRESIAKTGEEAVAMARSIGFPVVLKAVAANIPHKSDAGLVILGVNDEEAVRAAVDTIRARAGQAGAKLEGLLVAEQVSGGVEAMVGIHRDSEMGPVVVVGLGGVFLELLDEVAIVTPTVDQATAARAIAATRLGRLLEGYRGGQPGDVTALADAVVVAGRIAATLGDVVESLDINPLLVRERGQGAVALDALVVLRPIPAAG